MGRQTGKHSRHQDRSTAWQGRGAYRLWELSEHGQATASLIRLLKLKRNGERKRPTFHPPRSETICVQPNKHWYCFKGNVKETAERWGRARMGLLEFVCLLVGCLTSQQHARVSQGRICIEAADPTFYFTQSQYTDTGPTSLS